ncbi:MAG: DUF2470 domain-containing protein [Myxococcota bacterium]|nr:DUF2470 domain-containing protein [Myxococcota bacterium]
MSDEVLTTRQQAEIDGASENALRKDPAINVRQWLQDVHAATLSTLSSKEGVEGFPACSVVPFALDENGHPFILIARIAAHTRNLFRDQRASLFIRQGLSEGDPQAQWRATLMGSMTKLVVSDPTSDVPPSDYERLITPGEYEALKARYRERVPKADGYLTTHDFDFWRMDTINTVRYIAGFGRICWFDGSTLLSQARPDDLEAASAYAIEHMNDDHRDALEIICESLHGFEPTDIKMVSLDRRGFFMTRHGTPRLLYTSFGKEIDADGLRKAMVDVTRRARQAHGQS